MDNSNSLENPPAYKIFIQVAISASSLLFLVLFLESAFSVDIVSMKTSLLAILAFAYGFTCGYGRTGPLF